MQAQEVKREACHLAAYLEVALANLSAKILTVNQLNVELSGSRSLVSMLESKRERSQVRKCHPPLQLMMTVTRQLMGKRKLSVWWRLAEIVSSTIPF